MCGRRDKFACVVATASKLTRRCHMSHSQRDYTILERKTSCLGYFTEWWCVMAALIVWPSPFGLWCGLVWNRRFARLNQQRFTRTSQALYDFTRRYMWKTGQELCLRNLFIRKLNIWTFHWCYFLETNVKDFFAIHSKEIFIMTCHSEAILCYGTPIGTSFIFLFCVPCPHLRVFRI